MLYPPEDKLQRLEIKKDSLKTLNYFQNLLENIQWLRQYLKYPTGDLEPLSEMLKKKVVVQIAAVSFQKLPDKNNRYIILITAKYGRHEFYQQN